MDNNEPTKESPEMISETVELNLENTNTTEQFIDKPFPDSFAREVTEGKIFNPRNKRKCKTVKKESSILSEKVLYCPICNFGIRKVSNLNLHMISKQEVQCKDCKLYFGSCQSISIHKRGRCKGHTKI